MQSTRNKLIHLLAEQQDQYISGQLLSEKLNISRSGIWKHMKELEKDGYIIEAKSKLGYKIVSFPDKLSENTLKWGLKTEWLGKTIIHREVTESTQTIAHKLAREGAVHGTVVIADEQTKGTGRMNRPFRSNTDSGIWVSLILRPELLPFLASQLTLLTATVLADVIKEETGIHPQIKWPNDLLIGKKKLSGILTEMQAEQDQIQYVVIGVGMNVNLLSEDMPEDIKDIATSLQIELGKSLNIKELTQALLEKFEIAYTNYIRDGFTPVKAKWESYGFKIGEAIDIKTMQAQWTSVFLGIASDGALLTKDKNEKEIKLYSAEIDWFKEGRI